MEYIEQVLGVKVQYKEWLYEAELPYYILDQYRVQQAMIGEVKSIFIYPKSELAQIASVKKHIVRIQKLEHLPVVLILPAISRSRRNYMIAAKIPFIVKNKQLYLPFMGVVLQERFDIEPAFAEQLQPAAQVLFFYYIYQRKSRLYPSEAGKVLGFSAMTISRAVRQLEQTGFFKTEKEGVVKVLVGIYSRQTLFEKMQPYLISPVRKKIYVDKTEYRSGFYAAGLSALSMGGIINPTAVRCYAVDGKKNLCDGTKILMDAVLQREIEMWKYDPGILGREGKVDPLSLAVSLRENQDERVEQAVEELLKKLWEE